MVIHLTSHTNVIIHCRFLQAKQLYGHCQAVEGVKLANKTVIMDSIGIQPKWDSTHGTQPNGIRALAGGALACSALACGALAAALGPLACFYLT